VNVELAARSGVKETAPGLRAFRRDCRSAWDGPRL